MSIDVEKREVTPPGEQYLEPTHFFAGRLRILVRDWFCVGREEGLTDVVCEFLFPPDAMAKPDFGASDADDFRDIVNRQDWH